MPVKRRIPKSRRRALAFWLFELLMDEPLPTGANRFLPHAFRGMRAALWRDHGDEVLEAFVLRHPGRRPSTWWAVAAPGPRLKRGRYVESEAAFLRRHGLLGEAEGARLRRGAFRTVRVGRPA